MRYAIVTGSEGALGSLIAGQLAASGYQVSIPPKKSLNLTNRKDIERFAQSGNQKIDVLVNCAGLASISWMSELSEGEWDEVFDVNVKGPFLLTQALLPRLAGGTVVNITSRAARVPMRCSAAYNASKAALEMLTRQMGRELYRTHQIVVFGVAPNKLAGTPMSQWVDQKVCAVRGWSPEFAAKYEKQSRLVDEETPPVLVADFIAYLLSTRERHLYLNGCILNYGD